MRARDNPFRTGRTDRLKYRAPGFEWARLLARLERQGGRGAIRGAQGSGKTTLLCELGDRLPGLGFEVRRLRPSPDDRWLARAQLRGMVEAVGPTTALLLDGADRVGPFEWRRLCQSARTVGIFVITTHREGRLPTLHHCATSVALLTELAAELAPATELAAVSFAELFYRQQGNVRTALRALYDRAGQG